MSRYCYNTTAVKHRETKIISSFTFKKKKGRTHGTGGIIPLSIRKVSQSNTLDTNNKLFILLRHPGISPLSRK